jgi:hypothetical protein
VREKYAYERHWIPLLRIKTVIYSDLLGLSHLVSDRWCWLNSYAGLVLFPLRVPCVYKYSLSSSGHGVGFIQVVALVLVPIESCCTCICPEQVSVLVFAPILFKFYRVNSVELEKATPIPFLPFTLYLDTLLLQGSFVELRLHR